MESNKFTINPQDTMIGRAAALDRCFSNPLFRLLFLFIWLTGLGAVIFIVILATSVDTAVNVSLVRSLGWAYSAIGLFIFYLPLRSFYLFKVRFPNPIPLHKAKNKTSLGEPVNLFALFSLQLAVAARDLFDGTKPVDSKDLALALLRSPDTNFILARLAIKKSNLVQAIANHPDPADAKIVVLSALDMAIAEGHDQIEIGDIFVALCQIDLLFKQVLKDMNLEVPDVTNVVHWQTDLIRRSRFGKGFLDINRFNFTGGIGKDWAFGYAPIILRFGSDFTEAMQRYGQNMRIIGRDREVKQIEEVLLRQNGGNVLLVGEAGIGKRTTVLRLAQKIAGGELDSRLAYKHLIEVNIHALISGQGGQEQLSALFNEVARAGGVILYVEHFSDLLSGGGAGKINATELLMPFLNAPDIHIVATCSVAEFNQLVEPNTALAERFERITIEEPDQATTIRILEEVVPRIEAETGSIISYEALKSAVEIADKYIIDVPNPEKSIDLLDGASAHAKGERGETIILPKDISGYFSYRYKVPVGDVGESEKEKLIHLEDAMHKDVIGQDEAVKAVANALRRARAGVVDSKKPIGSFLFLGPTGVGKTETAKALAKAFFGSADQMIRFDMSEYQNKEDIYRFIGREMGGESDLGDLTTAVRENPFSVLLFDEIEKAHQDILDLFLQVLDEGHLTDGSGRKVLFSNTIIICTSNAGANLIRESIQNGTAYEQTKESLMDYLQSQGIYRSEFINRFTQVVAFSPLSESDISKVASLMIGKLEQTVEKNRGINVTVLPDAVAELARQGFDPEMGARPMARVIQEKVENLLAERILAGEIKKGDSITISRQEIAV